MFVPLVVRTCALGGAKTTCGVSGWRGRPAGVRDKLNRGYYKKRAQNEREDALASLPMCAVCMAGDVQLVVNLPCGHACSCKMCSDTARPCAICRGDVTQAVPVYFVSG